MTKQQDSQSDPKIDEPKTMEQRLLDPDEFADAWMAEPGEILVGTVIGIDRIDGKFGRYPVVTVRKDDGDELAFHAFRTVAKSELAKCRPVIGDTIGILYKGTVEGTDYHGYRVRIDRVDESGRSFDWNEFENEPTAERRNTDEDLPF